MLKSIPKSNISQRSFKVYKRFTADQSDYPVIKAYNVDGVFDSNSSPKDEGVFVHLLYNSIKAKYYTDNGLFNNFGKFNNPANFLEEREFSDTIYVINVNRIEIGEGFKPGSVLITNSDTNTVYADDGRGSIVGTSPTYDLVSIDFEESELIITADGSNYNITITSFDFQTGNAIITYNGDTDSVYLVNVDLDDGKITFTAELNFGGLEIPQEDFGNIFYSDGVIVFTNTEGDFENYEIEYRSTQTIHELEILVEVGDGEFNTSQNPSAVNVLLSGSYDFTTTPITNVSPAKTVKIKEVLDIAQRTSYSGSIGSTTGSWDDYMNYSTSDPTGSYLAPFVTTIGIYDKDGDMVAVAKLPQPIKKLPDYNLNFILRIDL